MKQEVTVTGMSCQGCANSVKTKFENIQEVKTAEIDLETNTAILDVASELPKATLQTALEDTNYEVV